MPEPRDPRTDLADELRALGREPLDPPRADLADRVLAAIADDPAPPTAGVRRWRPAGAGRRPGDPTGHGSRPGGAPGGGRRPGRANGVARPGLVRALRPDRPRALVAWVALLLAVALAVAVAAPPVRAAIRDLFGGVEVRHGPAPTPAVSPSLPGEHPTDLAGAARTVGFAVLVPAAYGAPDEVTVADGRVVSLVWHRAGGDVRLDEFAGDLGVMFEKYTFGPATRATVDGRPALWFDGPVALEYVDAAGVVHPESTRLTGRTLVWTVGRVTLRLDGVPKESDAIAVAAGTRTR